MSSGGVKEIADTNILNWNSFVEKSPQGTIFSTTKWMSLFDKSYRIIECEWGGIIGLLTPAFESGGFTLTPFQGVLLKDLAGLKETKKLSIYQKTCDLIIKAVGSGRIYNHYTYPDIRPFLWAGWKPDIKYTFIVKPDWNALDKQTRYEISRFDIPIEQGDVEKLDALYSQTFARKGLDRPITSELLKKLVAELDAEVWTTPNSAVCLINDSKRSYYILGASNGSGESSYCLWNAIKDKKEVDLVGCNDEKIAHFKQGFGGELKMYYGVCI